MPLCWWYIYTCTSHSSCGCATITDTGFAKDFVKVFISVLYLTRRMDETWSRLTTEHLVYPTWARARRPPLHRTDVWSSPYIIVLKFGTKFVAYKAWERGGMAHLLLTELLILRSSRRVLLTYYLINVLVFFCLCPNLFREWCKHQTLSLHNHFSLLFFSKRRLYVFTFSSFLFFLQSCNLELGKCETICGD